MKIRKLYICRECWKAEFKEEFKKKFVQMEKAECAICGEKKECTIYMQGIKEI